MAKARNVAIPTGQDVYDMLMRQIDTDLVSANVNRLDEMYKGETEEQRKARLKRYEQSFARYDKAFAAWSLQLQTLVKEVRHDALTSAERKSVEKEQSILDNLESQFAA